MVDYHTSWYWHCLDCGKHFKLPKATKYSRDKVVTPIYCPVCSSTHVERSVKEFMSLGRVKNPISIYQRGNRR